MEPETDPQLLARLIKHGGRILVVGGRVTEYLPKHYKDHPAILLWDDDKQGFQSKEVPQNTKAILYNKWISHPTVIRLNEAARKLHAIKYPMLTTREIKALLSDIVYEEQSLPAEVSAPSPVEIEAVRQKQEHVAEQHEQERMTTPQPVKKEGKIIGFVAKNLALATDWTQKGSMTKEGQRIFALAQQAGVQTTVGSVTECVRRIVKDLGKPTFGGKRKKREKREKPAKPTAASFRPAGEDDFVELDRLMEEAIAAIQLVQQHLPKVRSETERLRQMRQKMLDMLKA